MNKDRKRDRSRSRDRRDIRRDARRDLQSSSSAAEKASRLRMDSYQERNRTRPASPPRRKEMDNVMKKARREGDKSQFWNKKLLEAEEKDPNRWRHSGYKELYVERDSSQSRSRSKSRSRSPAKRTNKKIARARSPRSSPPRRRSRSRSPVRGKASRSAPARTRVAPPAGTKTRRSPSRKTASIHSSSGSSESMSSCSDDQCSVCSPKQTRRKAAAARSRSRSFSVPRSRPAKQAASTSKAAAGPGSKSSATIGRKPPSKPGLSRLAAARSAREKGSPPRDPRQPTVVASTVVTSKPRNEPADKSPVKRTKMLAAVKIEGQKKPPPPPDSDSDDSSSSSEASGTGAPKMTLSERFGKMAQWSVDRRDVDYMKNMKITKESDSTGFKVVIDGPEEEDPYRPAAPEFSDRRVGAGFFPETMHAAPVGMASWDDVRVRYKYYKGRGYLRDLSLDDYVKWEEWWYKYQEWLETERYYEQWAHSMPRHSRHHGRRFSRKQRSVSPLD